MFCKLDNFLGAHAHLRGSTARLFGVLTDQSLSQTVAPGHRTIAGVAWHIVTAVPEMMLRTGLPLSAISPEASPPDTAAAIVAAHAAVNDELAGALQEHWTDSDLATVDDMYGEQWARGQTLAILLHHEIHHRGQLTVLMRQAGLVVPGVFGPALEEWAQYGMEAPPY